MNVITLFLMNLSIVIMFVTNEQDRNSKLAILPSEKELYDPETTALKVNLDISSFKLYFT